MGRPRKIQDDPIDSDPLYPLGEVDELIGEPDGVVKDSKIQSVYVPKTPYNTELLIKQGKKVCPKCGGQKTHSINNEPRCIENLQMECPQIKEYYESKQDC